jgi:hypothetical protein
VLLETSTRIPSICCQLPQEKQPSLLWQSITQSAGPHAALLLTRISFDGRSPQLDGQILTKNAKNDKMHVEQIQERKFFRRKQNCGFAKGL